MKGPVHKEALFTLTYGAKYEDSKATAIACFTHGAKVQPPSGYLLTTIMAVIA